MGKRKVNNTLKAAARRASLKRQAANQVKRDKKGPSAGAKLAAKMAGKNA